MKLLFYCIILSTVMLSCGPEEVHKPIRERGISPSIPLDVEVANYNGRSVVYYTVGDKYTLYVLAEYTPVPGGEVKRVKASRYTNRIDLEGFASEGEYQITLYAVSEDELYSNPITVIAEPTTPPYISAFHSIEAIAGFGGVNIRATKQFAEDLVFEIIVKNEKGEWEDWDAYYTANPHVQYFSPNLEPIEYEMGFYVRDRWGNLSDTLFRTVSPLEEVQIDVSEGGYAHYFLPTDLPDTSPPIAQGWSFNKLFDGRHTGSGAIFFKNGPTVTPWHFTIDLKEPRELSRVTVFQRRPEDGGTFYSGGNVRKFRIWGSNNPNPDGSFDNSWVMLGEFENIKPSGLPPSTPATPADVEQAVAGASYFFDPDGIMPTDAVRYLRFEFIANWTGTSTMHMAELEIYGVSK